MNPRKCPRCGESFVPKSSTQQVCEREHFKQCENCGGDFPWSKRKRTCSTICTSELRRKHRKPKTCAWEGCGQGFQPGNGLAMYCSGEHYSVCEGCGTKFAVADIHRPSKACSPSCSAKIGHTQESQQKRRANAKEKYGVESYLQTEEFKKKQQKYWLENPEKDTRIGSEKFSEGVKKKYGVDNVSQSQEIKEKKRETYLKKYGVEQIMYAHINHLEDYLDIEQWAKSYAVDKR